MTALVTTHLRCDLDKMGVDSPECPRRFTDHRERYYGSPMVQNVKEAAKLAGWRIHSWLTFCPEHYDALADARRNDG